MDDHFREVTKMIGLPSTPHGNNPENTIYTSQQEDSEPRREQIVGLGVYLLRIDNRVTKKVVVL